MLDALTRLFSRAAPELPPNDPRVAVAVLLVHLAAIDGSIKPEEKAAVRGALIDFYGLSEPEVETLIAEATRRDQESVDLYRFTSAVSQLSESDKIEVVRMMWQVVFADHKNHELEDNMVWRVAELIHVSARDRNILRKQMARSE